jgi:hypothetical protein
LAAFVKVSKPVLAGSSLVARPVKKFASDGPDMNGWGPSVESRLDPEQTQVYRDAVTTAIPPYHRAIAQQASKCLLLDVPETETLALVIQHAWNKKKEQSRNDSPAEALSDTLLAAINTPATDSDQTDKWDQPTEEQTARFLNWYSAARKRAIALADSSYFMRRAGRGPQYKSK